jgi:nitrate/TMAO reductase-like tetraheme cytochrome c subunit
MRHLKISLYIAGFFVVLLVFFGSSSTARLAEKENHCFTCHTNAKKLIQITREITKADKGKPGASAETEGEG